MGHLRESGFTVHVKHRTGEELGYIKAAHGITPGLAACHTAEVGGYVVEGHVPADVIASLLREQPDVQGLSVPGMPVGSPGMEGPYAEPYEVLAFDEAGAVSVYAER